VSLSEHLDRLHSRCRREVSRRFARRLHHLRLSRPIISFTFDDFPLSAATVGGPILEQFGISATYYVSLGLAGTVSPTGQIVRRHDLCDLISAGHELGCHTFDHCHAWNSDARTFAESLDRNQRELNLLLPEVCFETMSYPISCPNLGVKREAARRFVLCRGGGQSFNFHVADRSYLKAFFLEKSRHRPEAVREIIARACAVNGWLIFVTHDICDRPTPYGCTSDFFEDVVKCAVNSGAGILPVMEAWKSICTDRLLTAAPLPLDQVASSNLS